MNVLEQTENGEESSRIKIEQDLRSLPEYYD